MLLSLTCTLCIFFFFGSCFHRRCRFSYACILLCMHTNDRCNRPKRSISLFHFHFYIIVNIFCVSFPVAGVFHWQSKKMYFGSNFCTQNSNTLYLAALTLSTLVPQFLTYGFVSFRFYSYSLFCFIFFFFLCSAEIPATPRHVYRNCFNSSTYFLVHLLSFLLRFMLYVLVLLGR